ncbi:MAG: sigma factor, partial [Polyangiaceae bacterium]
MWKQSSSLEPVPAPPQRASDAALDELCQRARAGERAAANRLLAALAPALLRVARQILGHDSPDVNDATQEAAIGVLRALPGFRSECTLLHFACRIAVLTAMNARRRRQSE